MSNPFLIKTSSVIIQERAKEILKEISDKLKNNEIISEDELRYNTYQSIKTFIESLNEPLYRFEESGALPIAASYNRMINNVKKDFELVFKECIEIIDAIEYAFHRIEIERQQIDGKINYLNLKMEQINKEINKKSNDILFEEKFINQNIMDLNFIGIDSPCSIQNEILTLQKITTEEVTDSMIIKVDGNGFLGNTHEIRLLNGAYQFFGEDNLRIDLNHLIDKNSDTWIEYEIFEVKDEVLMSVDYLGFDYKENVKWIMKENNSLELIIYIEIPNPKNMNWISLTPFLGMEGGTEGFILESIYVDNGSGEVNNILKQKEKILEEKVILFDKQKVKKIEIKMSQRYGYSTLVGHFFYAEIQENKSMNKQEIGKRINGDSQSVELLGYQYNPSTKKIIAPSNISQKNLYNIEKQKQDLFKVKQTKEKIRAGLEAIQAKRYMIGLRDINLAIHEFSKLSTFISKPYQIEKGIVEITFDATDYIPKLFWENEWIKYYISIDNGKTWIQIYKQSDFKNSTNKRIVINENIPLEGRFSDTIYIDNNLFVNTVRVKIELSRPSIRLDEIYYTPIVYDYSLKCKIK